MSSSHEEVSETDSKLLVCNTNDPSSTNPDDTSQQVEEVDVVQDEQHKEEVYQVVRLKLMVYTIIWIFLQIGNGFLIIILFSMSFNLTT